MNRVVAVSLAPYTWAGSKAEIALVEWKSATLRVVLYELQGDRSVEVFFRTVEGFRVLDERDLSEYWPVCSSPNGWIFEIHESGWMSQETRRGSLAAEMEQSLREFFIAGRDECVSVLSVHAPQIKHQSGAGDEA